MTDFLLAAPTSMLARSATQTYKIRVPPPVLARDLAPRDTIWLVGRKGSKGALIARMEVNSIVEARPLTGKAAVVLIDCNFARSQYFQDGSGDLQTEKFEALGSLGARTTYFGPAPPGLVAQLGIERRTAFEKIAPLSDVGQMASRAIEADVLIEMRAQAAAGPSLLQDALFRAWVLLKSTTPTTGLRRFGNADIYVASAVAAIIGAGLEQPEASALAALLQAGLDSQVESSANVGAFPLVPLDPKQVATEVVRQGASDATKALERGSKAHQELVKKLATFLQRLGYPPLSSRLVDVAAFVGSTLVVFECKSVTPANSVQQLRLGLGQVIDYKASLDRVSESIRTSVVTEAGLEPEIAKRYEKVFRSVKVELFSAMANDFPGLAEWLRSIAPPHSPLGPR